MSCGVEANPVAPQSEMGAGQFDNGAFGLPKARVVMVSVCNRVEFRLFGTKA
jgi:hypothetical protein